MGQVGIGRGDAVAVGLSILVEDQVPKFAHTRRIMGGGLVRCWEKKREATPKREHKMGERGARLWATRNPCRESRIETRGEAAGGPKDSSKLVANGRTGLVLVLWGAGHGYPHCHSRILPVYGCTVPQYDPPHLACDPPVRVCTDTHRGRRFGQGWLGKWP